ARVARRADRLRLGFLSLTLSQPLVCGSVNSFAMLVPTTVVIINLSGTATLHFASAPASRFVSFRLRDFVVPISGRNSSDRVETMQRSSNVHLPLRTFSNE